MLVALLLAAAVVSADDVKKAISLIRSKDPQDKLAGAMLVRNIGPKAKKAAPWLVKNLATDNWQLEATTARALVAIGASAMPALLKGMGAKEVRHRRAVARTIAMVSAWSYLKDIAELLADPDPQVRTTLAGIFVKAGETGLPALLVALGGKSRDQRAAAASALLQFKDPLRPARDLLMSRSAHARSGGAVVVGLLGAKAAAAVPRLLTLMKDKSAEVRGDAAIALGRIKAEADTTVPLLVAALSDPDPYVRECAVEAAAHFGAPAAEALVKALGTGAREGARRALLRMRAAAMTALHHGTKSDSAVIREASVRTIAGMDPLVQVYVDQLKELLEDDEASVRRAAADALARRAAWTAIDTLSAATQDPDASVRIAAVRALGVARPTEQALAALTRATKDGDMHVKLAAASSLAKLGEPSPVLEMARGALAGEMRDAAAAAVRPLGRAGEPILPDLVAALENEPTVPLVDALGAIAASHGNGLLGRKERFKRAHPKVRKALLHAMDWLARHQDTKKSGVNDADGRWHPAKFVNHHEAGRMDGRGIELFSPGVTGLAICVFLAAGEPEHPAAREGLQFLVNAQRPSGLFCPPASQHFQIDHAFATAAVCEAWVLTGNPAYRRAARRAVDFCLVSRNPNKAWRYEPRSGENDTNVTVAMLHALALAERGGLEVDPAAWEGGGRWLRSMTADGMIGYNMRGGSCARPEGLQEKFPPEESGAMVAAGLWGFQLIGRHDIALAPDLGKCVDTCLELKPRWGGGQTDMYYWHYATLYFNSIGGPKDKTWRTSLEKALLPSQRDDPPRYAGSWDPIGPWGADGGRIYSTALSALSLAAPIRFDDFTKAKPTGPYAKAARTLAKLAKSKNKPVAERAKVWLHRIG